MFSKHLRLGLAALLSTSILGCGLSLHETPPPLQTESFSSTACLSNTKPVIEAYLKGNANSKDVQTSWDCVSTALSKFERYVRGREADRYTVQELATFLEVNFLDKTKNNTISPELQKEFMKFKQILVGGTDEDLTFTELDHLLKVIESLRTITVGLNPYMKIYSMNWNANNGRSLETNLDYFEKANQQIQVASKSLAAIIEQNDQSYELADFPVFLKDLSSFFGETWPWVDTVAKYMPVVEKVKKALAGGDEASIAPKEWGRFTLLGARGYIQYLRYYYFIKEVPESQTGYRLAYLARSVEDIFSVFQDLIGEKPEGTLSKAEILDLLTTLSNVWPTFKVSSDLVDQGMKFKQLFFGGSADQWDTNDFINARSKVSKVKDLVEQVLPYYSIYTSDWDPSFLSAGDAQSFFISSQTNLKNSLQSLGALFEGSYDLENLSAILKDIDQLYPPENPESGLSYQMQQYLPFLTQVKNTFLGGNDSVIAKAQWPMLLGDAGRFYSDVLYYHYFLVGPWNNPQTLSNVSVFMNQSLDIVHDLLANKATPTLTEQEIAQLTPYVISLKMLPGNVQQSSLNSAVSVIVNNLFVSPQQRLSSPPPHAITLASVDVIRQEGQIWVDTETYLNGLSTKYPNGATPQVLMAQFANADKDSSSSASLKMAIPELQLSVDSPVAMNFDDQSRLVIGSRVPQKYSAEGLHQLNFDRALSRWIVRSVATDMTRVYSYTGVTLPELQGAYSQLQSLLWEAGFIDPEDKTFIASRFREANIFVPHGNGDSLASYAEITDLIGMLWSGIHTNQMLRPTLIRDCLGSDPNANDQTLVSVVCAASSYRASMVTDMVNLPDYEKYYKGLSKDDWSVYITNVMKASGYVVNAKRQARLTDLDQVPHVIQYSEMIFSRFNKKKDGVLSTADAIRAFPAFKGIMKELAKAQLASGSIKESELIDIFTFILRYGKPPTTLGEKLRYFFEWKGKQDDWDVAADRMQLSQILGYIAAQSASSDTSKPMGLPDLNIKDLPVDKNGQPVITAPPDSTTTPAAATPATPADQAAVSP